METLKKVVFSLVLLLGLVSANAQNNDGYQQFELVKNTDLEGVTISSMIKPIGLVYPEHGDVTFTYAASGLYDVNYTPDQDFIGEDYFVAEYYVNSGVPTPKYVHFTIDVKNSIIRTSQDFGASSLNTSVSIFPLENDFASHGPLEILATSFVSEGDIELVGTDELIYTPEQDYVGEIYINYIVQDSIGSSALGTIKLIISDLANIDPYGEIRIATTNKNPATILLPVGGFTVDPADPAVHGSVDFIGSDVVEYTSIFGNNTIDTFRLVSDSIVRDVIVEVINIPEPNGFVIDDYVITTVDKAVSFDVQANDIKKNFPIVDYTDVDELVQDENDESLFTYTPPAGFTGEVQFSYTVTNGLYHETAYITVLVSNFNPENNALYQLSTPKNTPLVINYDIPISNFSFTENAPASFGVIDIYEGIDTIAIGCEDITGYNLVTYTPSTDFVGLDQFELLYCVDDNNCELVKVQVEVADIGLDSICLCVQSCVWAGDADNDGKVSVADLLPIAYHQGLLGEEREEAGSASSWFGQHAEDWNIGQVYNDHDVKYVDANGDGFIAGDDLFDIEAYYNRFHDLVAPDNLVIKDFPFELSSEQDTVYAGDYLNLDISIGSEEYPVLNIHGLAYGLTFPAVLLDSASLSADYLNDGWFGSNSASLELAVQPTAGRLEASFSRTSGVSVSGYGIVAKVGFIVEEDIWALGLDDEVIAFDIHLEGIKVLGEGGSTFTLPPFTKTMYLDLRGNDKEFEDQDVHLYPNPTSDQIFIHVDKDIDIISVQLMNMNGAVVSSKNIGYHTARFDVADMNPGVYIARIEAQAGVVVRKFVVE